jgi:hypothetical protein
LTDALVLIVVTFKTQVKPISNDAVDQVVAARTFSALPKRVR